MLGAMGDAAVENPAMRDAPLQGALDLRMTIKEPGTMSTKEMGYVRDPGRLSGDSSDSDRSTQDQTGHPQTQINSPYSMEKSFISRSPPSTVPCDTGSLEEQTKEFSNSLDSPKNGADRIGGPVRPFKMYPHMDPIVYGSMLGGAVGSMGSGSLASMGLSSLYDSPSTATSPGSSAFGLGVTPMVSYVMQKRRRHEAREKENKEKEQSASRSPPATATSASSPGHDDSHETEEKKLKLVPDEKKDEAYWERRRKNNEAAKRSRDARRQKEEEIAMRAAFLEQENLKLRAQVAILKNETAKLHYLLYNRVWHTNSTWIRTAQIKPCSCIACDIFT